MTGLEHSSPRPAAEKLSVEQFEVIAQAAAREDVTLEYLNGQMETRTVPDSDHNAILMWLIWFVGGADPVLQGGVSRLSSERRSPGSQLLPPTSSNRP
ncbi:hypothetical protein [Nocardiopsis ganjiahuensis]|uniref:hypothetical protein n=1 Tax=Nocardiopsis ganjiahuensis TaxID=239984 RepID=UPI00034A1BA9|nr:hypothetical protein [Nocardiopsis ganjiahuensis]